MKRFAEAGVRLKHKHGQNFLIDLNLLGLVVDAAELTAADVVLEVGAGCGSLTGLLARRAAAVVSVEIDPQMRQLAAEELLAFDNVTLLGQDALAGKHVIAPEVLAAVEGQLAARSLSRYKLVANLPYSVATPIITSLLALDRPPESMTVTIQKELADRITARPGTKQYGALGVWTQSQCQTKQVRTLPPTAFWPRPKVSSAILRLTLDPERRARIADRRFFHAFVRAVFCHRRKALRGLLPGVWENLGRAPIAKSQADALLARLQLPADARAEQLDVDTLLALCDAARAWTGNAGATAPGAPF